MYLLPTAYAVAIAAVLLWVDHNYIVAGTATFAALALGTRSVQILVLNRRARQAASAPSEMAK
jgi:hypothetical protein